MILKKQLLCTFTNNLNYNDAIKELSTKYDILDKKVFVFVNENNIKDVYLTFNVQKGGNYTKAKGTISVHRKKQTNTLYTLNAMNKLIEDENNGVFDKTYQLNWELYKDSIILTNDIGVKVIPLKLFSITNI